MNFPDNLFEDLSKLVDYNYQDESDDYEEQKENGEEVTGHIFESITRLADWLDTVRKT